ncbi:hypothetical protein TSAR_009171 [Trichomalopsis sarcophagae]|uniref:Uncharacterized protein n=1 Tax=Trichomalopsis sarcophagae TaxID=543379 RepID=A0A232F695_9HYME|nr:hypothetical protein TSAR_009171 [Trichomalopsis sarcophagae]
MLLSLARGCCCRRRRCCDALTMPPASALGAKDHRIVDTRSAAATDDLCSIRPRPLRHFPTAAHQIRFQDRRDQVRTDSRDFAGDD